MKRNLKPCPHCGSTQLEAVHYNYCGDECAEWEDGITESEIHCFGCGSVWWHFCPHPTETIDLWNRRAGDE